MAIVDILVSRVTADLVLADTLDIPVSAGTLDIAVLLAIQDILEYRAIPDIVDQVFLDIVVILGFPVTLDILVLLDILGIQVQASQAIVVTQGPAGIVGIADRQDILATQEYPVTAARDFLATADTRVQQRLDILATAV